MPRAKIFHAATQEMKLFELVTRWVFGVMLLFLTLGIVIGTLRLFLTLGNLFIFGDITGNYVSIVSDVLTLFILIELSRSLADYFTAHRLRLTFIVDATLVFLMRDIMIGLFENKLENQDLYALAAMLLALTVLRIGSVVVFQRERHMIEPLQRAGSTRQDAGD